MIREYLDIIFSEVHNAEKVVSDLLDFSRTRPSERETITVSDMVPQALEKCSQPAEVHVMTEIAPDLPAVFVDPRQIEQVLVNLITNAYQAMPDGGCVTIAADELTGGGSIPDDGIPDGGIPNPKSQIRIQVSDTGPGVSQKNLKKLFEPLFTTKVKGIGMRGNLMSG